MSNVWRKGIGPDILSRQPNGVDCKYRHALPPGFVLKSEKKAMEELAKKEVISLEEFLETEVRSQ